MWMNHIHQLLRLYMILFHSILCFIGGIFTQKLSLKLKCIIEMSSMDTLLIKV